MSQSKFPEFAAIANDIRRQGGIITRGSVHDADGNLIAGTAPPEDDGLVEISAEFIEFARRWPPSLPKSPREKR